jgi:hypothetical protein
VSLEEREQLGEEEVMTPQELVGLRSRCEVGRDVLLYQPVTVLRVLNTVEAVVRERDEAIKALAEEGRKRGAAEAQLVALSARRTVINLGGQGGQTPGAPGGAGASLSGDTLARVADLAKRLTRTEEERDEAQQRYLDVCAILRATVAERDEARGEVERLRAGVAEIAPAVAEDERTYTATSLALLRLTRTFPWLTTVAAAGYTDEVARRELEAAYRALPPAPLPDRDVLGRVAYEAYHEGNLSDEEHWRRAAEAVRDAVLGDKK